MKNLMITGLCAATLALSACDLFTDPGLSPNRSYRYRVRACAPDGCSDYTDEAAARKNPFFEGRVAHGYLIVSFAAGLFVDPDFGPVLANYGVDDLRFAKPVNFGDTLKVRLTCKQKTLREGSGYGEVRWDTEVTNQDDEIVASYDVLTMVATSEEWEKISA